MVTWQDHILPVLATVATWFLATGLVAWIDHRDRRTFPTSMALAAGAAIVGLALVLIATTMTEKLGVYLAFAGALLIWGWHEVGFLTGAITGPRREGCPGSASPWRRFRHACAALAWHEIALLITGMTLAALTFDAPNPLGAQIFLLMLLLRLSTKLNIFLGVPNMNADILPPHLAYLKSYFGPRRLHPALLFSLAATVALAIWLGARALRLPASDAQAATASLLFGLAALGTIEHLFLALPVRDGALWNWALPARGPAR